MDSVSSMLIEYIVHTDEWLNNHEISQSHSIDGTAARTRPFSFDEIMCKRKHKKRKKHRLRRGVREEHASKKPSKVCLRAKDDSSKTKDDRIAEVEFKESSNSQSRSNFGTDDAKDTRKERKVHRKRKNHDRSTDDSENRHRKRHNKESAVKEMDKNVNRVKSERGSNRRTRSGNNERSRAGKQSDKKRYKRRMMHNGLKLLMRLHNVMDLPSLSLLSVHELDKIVENLRSRFHMAKPVADESENVNGDNNTIVKDEFNNNDDVVENEPQKPKIVVEAESHDAMENDLSDLNDAFEAGCVLVD